MSGRSRRTVQKVDKFKGLKDIQSGLASRKEQFQVSDNIAIYDEVSEDEYRKISRDLLKEESFVIDDDGMGYADGLLEDWEGQNAYSDDMDSTEEGSRNKNKGLPKNTQKFNRLTDTKPLPNLERIESAFSRTTAQSLMSSELVMSNTSKPRKKVTKDANSFMESLLADIDSDDESKAPSAPLPKKQKINVTQYPSSSTSNEITLLKHPTFKDLSLPSMNHSSSPFVSERSLPDSSLMEIDSLPPQDEPHFEIDPPSNNVIEDEILDKNTEPLVDPSVSLKKDISSPSPSNSHASQLLVKKISSQKPKAPLDLVNVPLMIAEPNLMTTPGISSFNPEQAFQENGALHFFFLDASEVKNVVYLFGKVKYANCFISCSLSVHNIERNVFLLPREYILSKGAKTDVKVEPIDVYNEFSNLRANFKIKKFASKFVDRKYSFEVPGVPDQAVWLKVAYSFNDPPLPSNFSGDTFSHAFGTTTSALELFLLKRHLMGPCWLYIDKPSMNTPSFSWSKLEGMVTNPKQVSVLKSPPPPPPLTLMAISSKCCLNEKNQQELLILTAVTFSTSFADDRKMEPVHHLTVARSPPGSMMIPMISTNEIKVHQNEKSLVNQFMANLQVQDPDILLGHNLVGFDVDLLMSRLKFMNHSGWSKVGRLRRAHFPKATYYRQFFSGRLLLDTYLAAKELIASSKSYSLNFLASTQLKKNRVDLDFSTIRSLFDSPDTVRGLLEYSFQDCILAVELAVHLNCISLYKQLSTICGSLLSRTMVSGRAERNEYLLLHEFHKGKFIVPDKDTTFNLTAKPIENEVDLADEMEGTGLNNIEDINESKNETTTTAPATSTSKRKKPQYAGGLVLEPKKGFYDSFVLLLDFNSLYPSIIQEYNICYTTVIRTEDQTMPSVPVQKEVGLLPRLIKSLVDRRKAVKKLMKDCPSHERNQYNIRQLALKLTANSMYGCLGFLHSRFYCKPLAMLITKLGRDILQDTVDLANQNGMNVIYGDTDSIMIHTGTLELHQVKQIGRNLQDLVNKKYKHLEIEMDGFFERMLLLKKKKYAALVLEEGIDGKLTRRIESKGLDLVRRDWCELSHDVSSFILHQLLESQESKEQVLLTIHEYLKDVAQKVREFHYPIEAFVITKSLTKHPKLYTDQQPHVSVALAMEERGEPVTVGSTVPYVICTSQEKALSSRARHPTDFQRDPSLRIDVEWYVAQQIFPPVARLCSEMEGSEQAHLAECLGLDSRKYDTFGTSQNSGQGIQTLESLLSLEERFANVEPLPLLCLTCSTPFVMNQSYATPSYTVGWTCPQCSQPLALSTLSAQVTHALRQQILRYENKWLVCDDISCQCRSRSIRVYPARCWRSPECRGKVMLEYSANQLYRQLTFFSYLFDVERMLKPTNSSNLSTEVIVLLHSHKEHYLTIHRLIQRYLDRNARMRVDLGTLFSFVRTTL